VISRKDKYAFDKLTERYDAWYDSEEKGLHFYEIELKCLKAMVDRSASNILEIGVGTGRFAMHFPNAVGADPSFNALGMAMARGVRSVQAFGEALPFIDDAFECVLIIATLSFVKNPVSVLREAERVLSKDGSIVIGFLERESAWGSICSEKKRKGHPFYSGANLFSFREVEDLLHRSSFRIASLRSTLLLGPDEPKRVEVPVDGHEKGAGFICLKAQKI